MPRLLTRNYNQLLTDLRAGFGVGNLEPWTENTSASVYVLNAYLRFLYAIKLWADFLIKSAGPITAEKLVVCKTFSKNNSPWLTDMVCKSYGDLRRGLKVDFLGVKTDLFTVYIKDFRAGQRQKEMKYVKVVKVWTSESQWYKTFKHFPRWEKCTAPIFMIMKVPLLFR